MPVAFDTHALITRLIHGQMPAEQAEAVSEALKEALDATIGQLVTKSDLDILGIAVRQETAVLGTTVRQETAALGTALRQELKHLKWMIGVNMTLTLLILGTMLLFKP